MLLSLLLGNVYDDCNDYDADSDVGHGEGGTVVCVLQFNRPLSSIH